MFKCTTPLSVAVVYCTLLIITVAGRRGQDVARSMTVADWQEDVVHTTDIGREDVVHTTDIGRDTITPDGNSSCCNNQYTTSSPSHNTVTSLREIPLNVIIELNRVRNVSELFSKFMPHINMDEAQTLLATTGFQKPTLIPKLAGCSLELQTVSLKDTDDRSLYYYPTCTRVNRCGGCCAHDLMACQPTKVDTLNFEVIVSQFNGTHFSFVDRKIVSIDQHLKCKCECIIKQENCNSLQNYYHDECRCVCSNEEDHDKCIKENDLKLWNPATCTCQCREIIECTSGFGFNYNTCGCEALRKKNKNPAYEFNRNTYLLGGT